MQHRHHLQPHARRPPAERLPGPDPDLRRMPFPRRRNGDRAASRAQYRRSIRPGSVVPDRRARSQRAQARRVPVPTDNAIYVDESPADFSVEFLERVFMKNKASYKAVAYCDASLQGGFWRGRPRTSRSTAAPGSCPTTGSVDFLASRFTGTPTAGTRRLAIAMRDAVGSAEPDVKRELSAAATLAPGLPAKPSASTTSANDSAFRKALGTRLPRKSNRRMSHRRRSSSIWRSTSAASPTGR